MKRSDWIFICILIFLYLGIMFVRFPHVFSYQFSEQLAKRYLRSQDIPHDVPGRLFLSDSDIHIAAGYLYAKGEDPTVYNFQHPPLLKYAFGFSTLILGNPLIAQLCFGSLLLLGTYLLARLVSGIQRIAVIASILLLADPLFHVLSSQAMLDVGQAALAVWYVLLILAFPTQWIIYGVVLGLFAASKFWTTTLFFVALILLYRYLVKEKIHWRQWFFHLGIAAIVFSLVYIRSFIVRNGLFNIVFFQLKILKYWFHHSVTSIPGASLILFMTGYLRSWWKTRAWVPAQTWSLWWPIGLVTSVWMLIRVKIKKYRTLVFAIPFLYLLYLGVQAPYERYFLIILPYLYIALSEGLVVAGKRIFAIIKRQLRG